jgi:hypothetical protein
MSVVRGFNDDSSKYKWIALIRMSVDREFIDNCKEIK